MGPKGAVEILFKDEIARRDDPAAATARLIDEYTGQVRPPLRGGGAGLHRRRDRSAGHPAAADRRAADPADQAGPQPAQEAWEHSAVSALLRASLPARLPFSDHVLSASSERMRSATPPG